MSWIKGKEAAETFRAQHGLGSDRLDIFAVVDGLPDVVAAYGDFQQAADGVYIKTTTRALVVINVAGAAVRQRFTVAHELGHHMLHGQAVPDLTIEDPDVYQTNHRPKEGEANAFAAYLLVPDRGLHAIVGQEPITPPMVGKVAAFFGVAWTTAVYRLHNAGLIVARQRDALCSIPDLIQARLITSAGGPPPGHEPGLPRELVDRVLDLFRRGVLTPEKVASMLDTTPEGLLALAHFEPRSEPPTFDAEAADELLRQLA